MAKVRFIRIGGRVIPIRAREGIKDAASAVGTLFGAAYLGTEARRKGSEIVRGKGKRGTGSALGNFAVDAGLSTAIFAFASKRWARIGRGMALLKARPK